MSLTSAKDCCRALCSVPNGLTKPILQRQPTCCCAIPRLISTSELPDLIRRYNESVGGVNSDTEGYHDTITRVFLHGVRLFLAEAGSSEPLHELVNALLLSPMGRRDWPLRFYSPGLLFSTEARRCFVARHRGPSLRRRAAGTSAAMMISPLHSLAVRNFPDGARRHSRRRAKGCVLVYRQRCADRRHRPSSCSRNGGHHRRRADHRGHCRIGSYVRPARRRAGNRP